jgi:outer membrane lipoprotein-sorting protein
VGEDIHDLLTGAASSFRTLRAAVHQRTDDAGMEKAVRRRYPVDEGENQPRSAPDDDRVIEFLERVWTDDAGRWRIERTAYPHGEPPSVTILDGPRWWLYSVESGAMSNLDEPEVQMGNRSVIEPLLNPGILTQTHDLEAGGRVEHAGRAGITVRAIPRSGAGDRLSPQVLGPYPFGDHHELIVDAERGIVLRDTGIIEGRPFWLTDIESIALDESLPDNTFVFEPPPGVELRTTMYPKQRRVSIEEAAKLVSFLVFMPTFVPAGTSSEVIFQPAQDRPPMNASVSIQYTGPDERSSIVVTEHETATLWEPLRSTEGWEVIEDAGGTFLFQDQSRFQAETAVRVDREGTTVFIHGGPDRPQRLDLDREVLFEIARSLSPVRS